MGQAYLVATAADDPDSGGSHAIDVAPDSIVTWDGKPLRIVNVGRNETTFMSEQGHIVALPNATFEALVKEGKILGVATEAGPGMSVDAWNLFMQASPRDQKDAVQRHDIIRPYLDGHPPRGRRDARPDHPPLGPQLAGGRGGVGVRSGRSPAEVQRLWFPRPTFAGGGDDTHDDVYRREV